MFSKVLENFSSVLRDQYLAGLTEPQSPVGNTVVADMDVEAEAISNRNAALLVSHILDVVSKTVVLKKPVRPIVESLIWPFVARRSLHSVWFTPIELGRFISSIERTAQVVAAKADSMNSEQSFVKYWLDYFLCLAMGDTQLPVKEALITGPLFVGWCRRFVMRRLAHRDLSFFYSLQKGSKRMWPALGVEKKRLALKKHYDRVCSFDRDPIPDDLSWSIRSASSETFRKVSSMGSKFVPSKSACLQRKRRDGGARSLVPPFSAPVSSETEPQTIGSYRSLHHSAVAWRRAAFNSVLAVTLENIASVEEERSPLDSFETVSVVAIPEPGKFRIITKGDGYLYTALQPLQGHMLDCWKRHRSSTMRDQDLTDRVRDIDSTARNFPYFCSVDYEAATDLLKSEATFRAFEYLENHPLYNVGLASLLPGPILYGPGVLETKAEWRRRRQLDPEAQPLHGERFEGQMMGHPLSFALLCVLNLAVYRCALRRWAKKDWKTRSDLWLKLRNNVIVNGDDMLFKCDSELYEIFLEVAGSCGFKMSQGKQYLSEDCCLINSQIFQRVGHSMCRRGYLNMKLVTGHGVKTGSSRALPTQIGPELNKMIELCPWTACSVPAAFARFRRDWLGLPYMPNWYLPVSLGGFGVDLRFAPRSWRITSFQRRLAAAFIHDTRLALYASTGRAEPAIDLPGIRKEYPVFGSYVPHFDEVENSDDPWSLRLAYLNEMSQPSLGSDVDDSEAPARIIRRIRPKFWMKPMSHKNILHYWRVRFFRKLFVPCPPLPDLTLDSKNRADLTDDSIFF